MSSSCIFRVGKSRRCPHLLLSTLRRLSPVNRTSSILFALLISWPLSTAAEVVDKITLKDGSVLKGEIKRVENDELVLDTDLSVDFSRETTPNDIVTVVATRPLTDNEAWTTCEPHSFIAFEHGVPV